MGQQQTITDFSWQPSALILTFPKIKLAEKPKKLAVGLEILKSSMMKYRDPKQPENTVDITQS
jgi:hypothetical protein